MSAWSRSLCMLAVLPLVLAASSPGPAGETSTIQTVLGSIPVRKYGIGGARVAICIHGASLEDWVLHEWDAVAAALAEELDFTVFLPNLHALPAATRSDLTPTVLAEALLQMVSVAAGGGAATAAIPLLLGKSWGGGLAAGVAALPSRPVQQLVLVAPTLSNESAPVYCPTALFCAKDDPIAHDAKLWQRVLEGETVYHLSPSGGHRILDSYVPKIVAFAMGAVLSSKRSKAKALPQGKVCCDAMIASCLACQQGMSTEDFCKDSPSTAGCKDVAQNISQVLPAKGGASPHEIPHVVERCCKALSANCLACRKGVSAEEYCRKSPRTMGCRGPSTTHAPGGVEGKGSCCKAFRAKCLACAQRVSVEEYCSRSPKMMGCPGGVAAMKAAEVGEARACCRALTAECMACAKGTSIAAYCRGAPGTPGCAKVVAGSALPTVSVAPPATAVGVVATSATGDLGQAAATGRAAEGGDVEQEAPASGWRARVMLAPLVLAPVLGILIPLRRLWQRAAAARSKNATGSHRLPPEVMGAAE